MSLGAEAPSRGVALTLHTGKNPQGFMCTLNALELRVVIWGTRQWDGVTQLNPCQMKLSLNRLMKL
jgi:hypothetical protein